MPHKLGTEMMQEFSQLFAGLMGAFQPTGSGPGGAPTAAELDAWAGSHKEPIFGKYAELAFKCAKELANYQQPKMASVSVAAPPPAPNTIRKKFTINIFDHQGRPAPRYIDLEANKDPTLEPGLVARRK